MPKDEIVNSASFDETTTSPCSKDSDKDDQCDISGSHVGDGTEWEEIQCPICMERPHNAVLLNCSSRDKGCRPFICDTLHPHSNCLDQFRKLSTASSSSREYEIACPLCRGAVTGFDVVGPARVFMDSQKRGCSAEGCGFAGSYRELKRHALVDHFFDGGESFSDESEVSDFDEDEEDEVVFGEASAYFFGSEYYGRNNAMSVPLRSNDRRGNGSTRLRENRSSYIMENGPIDSRTRSRDRGENVQYRSSSRYFIPG